MKNQNPPDNSPLVDRREAAKLLNVGVMTVKRIEWDGKLKPVKLRNTPTSKKYYHKSAVYKLMRVPMPEA